MWHLEDPRGNKHEVKSSLTRKVCRRLGRHGGSAAYAAKSRHVVDTLNGRCGLSERMSRHKMLRADCVIGRSRFNAERRERHMILSRHSTLGYYGSMSTRFFSYILELFWVMNW